MNARFAIPFALRLLLFTLVDVAAAGSAHAVLLPVLSPDGGRYATYRPVKVTCGTAGAALRYTLYGLEPTAADPLVASGASITLSSDTQLRVKAFGAVRSFCAPRRAWVPKRSPRSWGSARGGQQVAGAFRTRGLERPAR